MDLDMYRHPSTAQNFDKLSAFGNTIIPAGKGELASGLSGKGRMAEPEEIVGFIEDHLLENLPLKGKKILITAGPTYESIDPVRFIGNHSSGKMGYELAGAAAAGGAEVILISGPTYLENPKGNVRVIRVSSAQDMLGAVMKHYSSMDIAIAAAAVSDYRPVNSSQQKIKKTSDKLNLELEKNPDILLSMGQEKKSQLLIGFALETENEEANATAKLRKKNLDFIVLNSLVDKGAGFKTETNKICIIFKGGKQKSFPLKSKKEVAADIINEIILLLDE
ncbi:MAG TPA: bifunctional phosphopantothenoylcysteine decarboxylase/phosphopantothenate--cysteine ligase CoaBC, partial [Salinimicrobium sp.]|nr:bifunctional phosphopantothenoylcysteine decarboxylase/phosphopantothenate--cysteine ligase CoaBC [Salinimicrobium sp.]